MTVIFNKGVVGWIIANMEEHVAYVHKRKANYFLKNCHLWYKLHAHH